MLVNIFVNIHNQTLTVMICSFKSLIFIILDYVVVIQPDGSFMNTNYYDNITFVEELASLTECSK